FVNPHLKNKESENGYRVYLSDVAQKQLNSLTDYKNARAHQIIQSLSADPRPGKSNARMCVKSECGAHYLVAHDLVVQFQRNSEKVFVEKALDINPIIADSATASELEHAASGTSKIKRQVAAGWEREHYMKHGVYPRVNGKRQSPGFLDKLARGYKVLRKVDVSKETAQFMDDNPDFVNGVKLTTDLASISFRSVRAGSNAHVGVESAVAAYNGAYGDAAIGVASLIAGTGSTHFLKNMNIKSELAINTLGLGAAKSTEAVMTKDCSTCVK